jgi:hypothetical protein
MKTIEHLNTEVLEKFIGRDLEGCVSCPVERHLAVCPECLEKLERLLGRPARPGSARKAIYLFGVTNRTSKRSDAKSLPRKKL